MLTNIVEAEHGSLRVGMPLEVVFEPRGDVVLPQFRPAPAESMTSLTRDIAVVGVGYSPLSRDGAPNPRGLTFTAVQESLADAGLQGSDVDGIFEYKFGPESPSAQEVARLIGSPNLKRSPTSSRTTRPASAGRWRASWPWPPDVCETVVSYRCLTRAAGYHGGVAAGPVRVPGTSQFLVPYGFFVRILTNMALVKQRWMAEYHRPEEDFGHIAVNARRWSSLNPRAVLREKISMDDYLESRMIVDPLRLLDCDYPSQRRGRHGHHDARTRPRPACAAGASSTRWRTAPARGRLDVPRRPLYGGTIPCSKRLWERSSFGLDDVDVAQVYDGFTNVTLHWIEALGFCGIGEFGDWIGDGTRIDPGGDMPLNTAGGQLAEGRLHGVSFLNEAVLQLQGKVRDAPGP